MKHTSFLFLCFVLLTACSKSYLETNPSNGFGTIDDLGRLKSLLDNDLLMRETPVLGEESADDHYFMDGYFNGLPQQDQHVYTWEKDVFLGKINIPDYNIPYAQVFTCNLVLEGLGKITPGMYQRDWSETKGSALFMRSYAFFNLAQIFAAAYDSGQAETTPGISLPLSTDINIVPARSSLKATYDQIITDLNTALPLVPRAVTTKSLPSKPAVYALLARIYLSKGAYNNALAMADSCIHLHDSLLDFTTLNRSLKYPIPATNKEILYQSWLVITSNVIMGRTPDCIVDSSVYRSYDINDLRKEIYFMSNLAAQPVFRNNGTGKAFAFSGLSIPEMYLIRAECRARLGAIDQAIDDINKLQEKRYQKGTFNSYSAANYAEAMAIVLRERRKELIFRGLRWTDLKRLNKEEAGIVLTRLVNGRAIPPLLPNSNRYILPIPDDALSGGVITQNVRN